MNEVNQDVIDAVRKKEELKNQVRQLYKPLVDFISNLDINANIKSHSLTRLDEGILWACEGVNGAEIKLKKE